MYCDLEGFIGTNLCIYFSDFHSFRIKYFTTCVKYCMTTLYIRLYLTMSFWNRWNTIIENCMIVFEFNVYYFLWYFLHIKFVLIINGMLYLKELWKSGTHIFTTSHARGSGIRCTVCCSDYRACYTYQPQTLTVG